MKFRKLQIGFAAFAMAAAMGFFASASVYAAEQTELVNEESVSEGTAEGELDENGNPVVTESENEAPQESGTVVMSGLPANNGREIAAQFPEEYIPEGFHKSTCTYEGQTIEIAYMDNGNGEVVLAYLADSDGSNGDFYLCDINTAEMSDFVQIYGGEGKYIIVLDPRDMIVPPAGFTKANLQWYGKSVSAWLLPGNNGVNTEEEGSTESAKTSISALFEACAGAGRTMTVYAAEAGEAAAGAAGSTEPDAQTGTAADTSAAASSNAEDGSGVVEADPSQYFLVYAINQDGVIGFYMYDTTEGTYQRYVQVDSGEGATVEKYRSSAQKRLVVIAVLAVALVICLFVMINLILKQREREDGYEDEEDEDDEEDEMELMRRRVAKKEKSHIRSGRRELNYLMDIEDEDEDEEDDEDEEEETDWNQMEVSLEEPKRPEKPSAPQRASAQKGMTQKAAPQKAAAQKTPAQKAAPQKAASPKPEPQKPAVKKAPKPDLDEDFEFEFLDI